MDAKATWVATLSDGDTAVERVFPFDEREGERTPWVRLCNYASEEGLFLTSLRLNYNGRTIHMPRDNFNKFGYDGLTLTPTHYSLSYHIEGDLRLDGTPMEQSLFVDMAAHYEEFTVHFIQGITNGNSWVTVTSGDKPLAPSPKS